MNSIYDSLLSFTDRGWDALYNVVDDPYFRNQESGMIYDCLSREMRFTPFCEYLKRFLYRHAELEGPYQDIPLEEYQSILRSAFRESGTPSSFEASSTKFSAASRNWLTQKSVSRQSVLLLGFGLSMSAEEVNDFLVKGLHEEVLRQEDPRELICGYCYLNDYTFPKYEELWELFEHGDWDALKKELPELADLLKQIQEGLPDKRRHQQYKRFRELYETAVELLAVNYNRTIRKENPVSAEEITAADIEHILYSAIPKDAHGNLTPAKQSSLFGRFEDKRLTRQRINTLLRQDAAVSREDLITLQFFIWSQVESDEMPP